MNESSDRISQMKKVICEEIKLANSEYENLKNEYKKNGMFYVASCPCPDGACKTSTDESKLILAFIEEREQK